MKLKCIVMIQTHKLDLINVYALVFQHSFILLNIISLAQAYALIEAIHFTNVHGLSRSLNPLQEIFLFLPLLF